MPTVKTPKVDKGSTYLGSMGGEARMVERREGNRHEAGSYGSV